FHLILVERIKETGARIHDWLPFEVTKLNYPVGMHLLLALASRISGKSAASAFLAAQALFAALNANQLRSLVLKATRNVEVSLFSMLIFVFWCFYGSTDYLLWGGLPNLIGMYLFLTFLTILHEAEGEAEFPRRITLAILFVGISIVHHH